MLEAGKVCLVIMPGYYSDSIPAFSAQERDSLTPFPDPRKYQFHSDGPLASRPPSRDPVKKATYIQPSPLTRQYHSTTSRHVPRALRRHLVERAARGKPIHTYFVIQDPPTGLA
ncbi:hypothetical protein D9611_014768 [Ephemerocybe angulata]|uniref:Uncharacterized protein n=1 Tax=Ephemerocybe angulata TaxID=980116 RepID=A0A8H5F8X0_9AGAR|nr:hypothetical protein D9611_014768 [Tulosesus angulatus]